MNGTSTWSSACTRVAVRELLGHVALLELRAVEEVDTGQVTAVSHSQLSATAVPMPASRIPE